ncbi:Glycosyl phosphatidyl inositol protein transamidase complex subunit [Coemansia biformis]|uniref:Glycosyl phosphatidyl inositol protein transamidase complex subunit n=1 Tax=Coemansia biformis TaxID=1286918 RepID=A0A9W8CWR2_9FUNG|nr:Glycosyl phosphatidyl inositol protein transamidase complex subunit [Coemansia biformis]
MTLVLSGQGEKTSPLLRAGRKYSARLCYPLAAAGIVWLLLLPLSNFWNRAYFSENAMMPGQVDLAFGAQSHLDAMASVDAALAQPGAEPADWPDAMARVFSKIGLDTEVQRIVCDEVPGIGSAAGANVHGIVRAPRSDSVEALLVAAAWRTADNATNVNAVRLMAGLAQYASEQVHWAKDIIFVVTDAGEPGIEAWLRAYHGLPTQAPLSVRGGIIQAALSLELPPARAYARMGLFLEGKGGQLPNLDFVNIVQHIARIERLPAYIHGMEDPPRRASLWQRYLVSARLLLRQMRSQAFGSSMGVHAPLLRYRIDALTVAGIPRAGDPVAAVAQQGLLRDDPADMPLPGPATVRAIGRTVESTLRSLNNLLEHFHQSFFFYILPANQRYLSIGDYIPAVGLMVASLLFQAMHLWWMQGPDSLRSDNPRTRIERINTYYALLRRTLPSSIGIILRAHALGLVLLAVPILIPPAVLTNTTSTAYLFTMALASVSMVLHIADVYWAEAAHAAIDWRQLKALVEMYVAVVIASLSVMNVSLAVGMFVVTGLPLILTRMCSTDSRLRRAIGLALLLAASPECTMTLGRNVVLGLHPLDFASSPFRMFLGDFHHFSSLVYPLVCLVYWPVNLLCMVIVLVP